MQMLKRILALTISMVACPALSQTIVKGPITTDEFWTTEGSPYILPEGVSIVDGGKLTIAPGVEVRLGQDASIIVGTQEGGTGELFVLAPPTNPVVFTSNAKAKAPGDWGAIVFERTAVDAAVNPATRNHHGGCIIQGAVIEFGGGDITHNNAMVRLNHSTVLFRDVDFRDSAGGGAEAGLYPLDLSLYVIDSSFQRCGEGENPQYGGGLSIVGGITHVISGCLFTECNAQFGGGLSHTLARFSILEDLLFTNCVAASTAGAAFTRDCWGLAVSDTVVRECSAVVAAGFFDRDSPEATFTNIIFEDNFAHQCGAMLSDSPYVEFTNCDFIGNSASMESDSMIGALEIQSEQCVLDSCLFENNFASGTLGALRVLATKLTMRDCDFRLNNVDKLGSGIAGAAYFDGRDHNIERCNFYANYAPGSAGALTFRISRTSGTLTECTFNRNATNGDGGAIFFLEAGPVILGCTFTQNFADRGGAIFIGRHAIEPTIVGDPINRIYNNFIENQANLGMEIFNNLTNDGTGSNDIDISHNCWGARTAQASIEYGIYHHSDDTSRSTVKYLPTGECPCPADFNGDDSVTPTDFTAWTNAFINRLPGCDQNGDGLCTPTDFTAWIANFNAGC
jgi:hypothetical protein